MVVLKRSKIGGGVCISPTARRGGGEVTSTSAGWVGIILGGQVLPSNFLMMFVYGGSVQSDFKGKD